MLTSPSARPIQASHTVQEKACGSTQSHRRCVTQGIEDKFLEQWHQKLHTNTTPADITICESYIDFLHSGDGGLFWQALWEKGGLTRDALATMDHPITGLTHWLIPQHWRVI